jgi:hypothetical protein
MEHVNTNPHIPRVFFRDIKCISEGNLMLCFHLQFDISNKFSKKIRRNIVSFFSFTVNRPIGHKSRSQWPRGLRPLACWDRGFDSL